VASIQKTANGRYRARYRDSSGKEHLKRFALKREAQRWLDAETAKIETGTWVAPRTAKTTVGQWCDTWLRKLCHQETLHRPAGAGARGQDQRAVRYQKAR
jgi:hypothetical protein